MRTNVVLDDDLIAAAMKFSGVKTKRAVIREALREFVEQRRRLNLLDLEGKIEMRPGYDHKRLRAGHVR